jgi:hypothetical protein
MNGKAGPDITPVLCKKGERVRLRFVNMGMDHHPMHMHGHQWVTTGTEGGRIPRAAWQYGNTELVGVAQVRTVEFVAKYHGDWMLHCHLPHHMMNQMVSMVGPMTEGAGGLQAGLGMNEGMGMIHRGGATSDTNGPSLGRGMGMAAEHDRASSAFVHQGHEGSEEAKATPGFPQDMWMVMDHLVDHKPENYGLRKEWTASMMGMMTLVRVLEPELFDKIAELKRQQSEGRA